MKKPFKTNNNEINAFIEKYNLERENEIHKVKELSRVQLFEIKEEYKEKAKQHQDKLNSVIAENEQIKKELSKNKNFEEVKALHQKLESLRKASFQELISIK